jgi:hypothetical protein
MFVSGLRRAYFEVGCLEICAPPAADRWQRMPRKEVEEKSLTTFEFLVVSLVSQTDFAPKEK